MVNECLYKTKILIIFTEHKVTDICSTDIADNLVTTPSGYILTPEYPKSLPSSPEPCIKILTNNNGDFASFTIISLDFQLVDSVLCNEEDVEYLKISYVDGYNQLVSMFYCGKNTLINVTILAYEVTLELKRESGVGNPGFLLEYEGGSQRPHGYFLNQFQTNFPTNS